jgi:hypothetical protein
MVVAPTAMAAKNIQGITLDSWLQLPPETYRGQTKPEMIAYVNTIMETQCPCKHC